MTNLFSTAGRAFLRAFLAALLFYAIGIVAAPSLHQSVLIGIAALLGALSAGIKVLADYVPQLSLVSYLGHPYGDWADSFLHAFLGSLILTLPGVLQAPDLSAGKSLAVAAVIGALSAGIRALQGLFTIGEHPVPQAGLAGPSAPPTPSELLARYIPPTVENQLVQPHPRR